jgi:glycosyltransferase involved in cell wall biosynthesis
VTIKLGVVALAGPDNGGTYQYTLSMLQALQYTRGLQVTIYGDPQNPDFARLGYPVSPFVESRARQLAALMARRTHVRLPDPFVAEDVLLSPIYALSLLHTSKPFAYTLHDLQESYFPENFPWWQRNWRRQVYTQLSERAGRVICESQYVKTDIERLFGVAEEKIAVIAAPPLRQVATDQTDDELQSLRVRLQLPDSFLFYPAQFWPHKNHLRLLEAFHEAATEIPNLHLVLTGKKRDEYNAVMSSVSKLGLDQKVHHLGYIEQADLQAIYKLATALVMPSLFESVSIPIYEAFQAGTPVVASNILAMPEQVGDAGLLFDPRSVASIRDAIVQIARDPAAARQLGKRGQERMSTMTLERYGAQLQDLLNAMR